MSMFCHDTHCSSVSLCSGWIFFADLLGRPLVFLWLLLGVKLRSERSGAWLCLRAARTILELMAICHDMSWAVCSALAHAAHVL